MHRRPHSVSSVVKAASMSSSAASTTALRIWVRSPSRCNSRTIGSLPTRTRAMYAVPTRFPSDGSGPATPVVATPQSVSKTRHAPAVSTASDFEIYPGVRDGVRQTATSAADSGTTATQSETSGAGRELRAGLENGRRRCGSRDRPLFDDRLDIATHSFPLRDCQGSNQLVEKRR